MFIIVLYSVMVLALNGALVCVKVKNGSIRQKLNKML